MSVNIVSETRRDIPEKPPPENTAVHIWQGRNRTNHGSMAAYINKHAEAKMRNHALAYREKNLEVMGLLLGEVRTWQGREYVLVRDAATTDLDATSVSVKFDSQSFEKLFENLDEAGFDYIIVGWYHSHPGYGCFLSETDLKTHDGIFVSPHQLAIVIDPLNFQIGGFHVRDGEAVPVDFMIYWDIWDDPYGGLKRIRR